MTRDQQEILRVRFDLEVELNGPCDAICTDGAQLNEFIDSDEFIADGFYIIRRGGAVTRLFTMPDDDEVGLAS